MVGSATSMHHAQLYDVALRTTAVSGVPIQPFSDRVTCLAIGTTLLICTNSSVLISVLRFLRAIDFEMVGIERGQPADQRCTRNDIVLFGVASTG